MDYFKFVSDRAERAIKAKPQDYTEGGLLHCGDCGTPKQCTVEVLGEQRTVMCLCRCEAERMQAEKNETERQKKMDRAAELCGAMGFARLETHSQTFANDDGGNPELMTAARNYAENFSEYLSSGKGLLLFGDVGTGKSYAAACIVNYLVERGIPAAITNFARISNKAIGLFEGRQEYYDSFNKLALLAIDDLFSERDTKSMDETIHAVIDARARSGLPIIVTTNRTAEQLRNAADIGERRIISRIMGMTHPIRVAGADRRIDRQRAEYGGYKDKLGL